MTTSGSERLSRWRGARWLALVVLAAALAYQSAALAVAALIPVAFAGYARLSRATDRTVCVERSLSPTSPAPGEHVTVELEITSSGGAPISDLRLTDGVPAELAVVAGSPRIHVALAGDDPATVSYEVIAKRGDFEFDTPEAEIRSVSGSVVSSPDVKVTGAETLTCRLLLEELPLRDQTIHFVGQVQTDVGGSGVEFHSTREYRHGDPVSRIDWRRYARGGGLTTVEFREEQASPVVFLVDARPVTRVARGPGYPTAFDLCQYGAERGTSALIDNGNTVGLSLFGRPEWVAPGNTATSRDEVSAALDLADAQTTDNGGEDGFDVEAEIRSLRQQLPTGAQVVFWTPMLDDSPVAAIRQLEVNQIPVTVVSPDITKGDTPGKRVAALERKVRLQKTRISGSQVVDWDTDEPVELALRRAFDGGVEP